MNYPDLTLERVAITGGYVLLGAVGTAVLGMLLLPATEPVQVWIYDALFVAVGPWSATTTATIVAFTLAGVVAISLPTLLGVFSRSRFEHLPTLVAGLVAVVVLLAAVLLLAALVGAIGYLTAIVSVVGFAVAAPIGLRYLGAWAGGGPTFVGGIPVLVLLLFLLGFGLGWGGGYELVATEVPASTVNGSADADFSDVPQLRDDLLSPDEDDIYASCEQGDDGRRTCRLSLRGYEDEARAAQFLDRHGVRCSFLNAPGRPATGNLSFVATDDGTFYRVTCNSYGD